MPGGAFNTSKFIQELGLKPVGPDEMRIREDIQPVLIAGDLSSTTPAHEQPAALLAAETDGAPGRAGMFEVQCLSPGGAYVGWFVFSSASTTGFFRVTTTATGVSTVSPGAGQLSREPILSILRIGDVAPTGLPHVWLTAGFTAQAGWREIYVPHGSFFQVEHGTNNVSGVGIAVHWREVVPAENVPA